MNEKLLSHAKSLRTLFLFVQYTTWSCIPTSHREMEHSCQESCIPCSPRLHSPESTRHFPDTHPWWFYLDPLKIKEQLFWKISRKHHKNCLEEKSLFADCDNSLRACPTMMALILITRQSICVILVPILRMSTGEYQTENIGPLWRRRLLCNPSSGIT